MTAWLITQAWPYLLGLIGIAGVYFSGRHAGKIKAHRDTMDHYAKQRKAADNADLGIGASDDERVKRLRRFADE